MGRPLVLAVLVGAFLVFAGSAQTTPNYVCTGFTSGATYGNVTVPAGASCTLDGVRVTGNVTVGTGADLLVSDSTGDSTIAKNVTGNGCDSIDLESTGLSNRVAVGGNLTITNCTGFGFSGGRGSSFSPPVPPQTLLIGGNVKCDNDAGGCVFDYAILSKNLDCSGNFDCELESDAVGGNVTIDNSTSDMRVDNSVIGGDLACSGNSGPTGSGDTVAGNKSGDCSAF